MVRTIAIALFGLLLACAAQAMPVAPVHQPDGMITQARMGCGAQVMVNGVCQSRAGMRRSAEPCAGVHDIPEAVAFGSTNRSSSSGSLAMLAAIRRASSRVSNCPVVRAAHRDGPG